MLGCNSPFQPKIEYHPKLNIYSVLIDKAHEVFVRVTSVVESPSDVSQPVHGALVTITRGNQTLVLIDTVIVSDGDTSSFYVGHMDIFSGEKYTVSATKSGYPTATAQVIIPYSHTTMPDRGTYAALINPKDLSKNFDFNVEFSGLAKAAFVQMAVECRGLDASGKLHVGFFNVLPVVSSDPFFQIDDTTYFMSVDTTLYQNAFNLAKEYAADLDISHLYADIIVTQVDDNLYRFFITSNHSMNTLAMRTDKVIFSNIFDKAGAGVVAGASIDTTRIFLF
jgi:hypothetical protein